MMCVYVWHTVHICMVSNRSGEKSENKLGLFIIMYADSAFCLHTAHVVCAHAQNSVVD